MIDGAIARKVNAESELGSRIDSAADLVFVVCSAILVLPLIDLPIKSMVTTTIISSDVPPK